jgi:hypothetical protein
MKKLVSIALLATAAIATPAMAQSTGTITINGSVAGKCAVVTGTNAPNWAATVNMGELAKTDGTLKTSADLETAFNAAAAGTQDTRVVCTVANPKVSVNANPLVAQTNSAAPGSGYADTVQFQADVKVYKATTAAQTYSNDSAAAAGSLTAIGDRLAATGTNIEVRTSNWRTTTATDLMVADSSYQGSIVVTISPI